MPTSDFKYLQFPYPEFNPVQAEFLNQYDQDANFIIAARTSAGKTTLAEMLIAHTLAVHKKKAIYLSPLKAISEQKAAEWTNTNHGFSSKKILICTGDYMNIPANKFAEAEIIIMTSESLDSKTRMMVAEKHSWLLDVGCIIVDEVHLLAIDGRGDALEAGLMRFTNYNKDARLLAISGTLPNVEDIGKWFALLNGKPYKTIISDYRPIETSQEWIAYSRQRGYNDEVKMRIQTAVDVARQLKNKKIIFFVHSKKEGAVATEKLEQIFGKQVVFLSADLEKSEKLKIIDDFNKNTEDSIRCIVATSVIAWGVNTTAAVVILCGFKRGQSLINPYDVVQMAGRAGRIGYSKTGEVYYVCNMEEMYEWKKILKDLPPIESAMIDSDGGVRKMGAHIVAEIKNGEINDLESALKWYQRTFRYFHYKEFDREQISIMLEKFVEMGIIDKKDDKFVIKKLGIICTAMYYDPWTVYQWKRNFANIFEQNLHNNEIAIAWALANVSNFADPYVASYHQKLVSIFESEMRNTLGTNICQGKVKATAIYLQLKNRDMDSFKLDFRNFVYDIERVFTTIGMIDKMCARWDRGSDLEILKYRVKYGVQREAALLCSLPHIGGVRAKKLYEYGIRSVKDFRDNKTVAIKAIGEEIYNKVLQAAK
jgi:replicative superfamily II helicase